MQNTDIAQNKMAYLPISRLLLQMSLPPLISMFFQYSYNLVDSIFVAHLGEQALTAVSLSFPITTMMNAASVWIGVGVNVLIAGHLGENQQDRADNAVTHGLLLSVFTGILLNAAALLFMKPYFHAFTNDVEIYRLSVQYMGVCAFMQIPNMVHITIQKMLQATGNMIAPMWFQIAGVVVNFILNPFLIFGMGPLPQLGITGSAIATVAGYTFSMMLAFIMLFGTKQKVRAKIHGFHMEYSIYAKIFALGLPSFIMNVLGAFMVTFVNLFLVAYSATAIAFFGAYFKIQQLIVMTINGLIQGCLPIMRFNYSAGNTARMQQAFRCGTIGVSILMLTGTALIFLFPIPILTMFAASENMFSFGIPAMKIMASSFLFNGISTMIATRFQATGHLGRSILLQLLRQMLLLIPAFWLLDLLYGMTGIWIAFPVTETLTLLIALWMLRNTGKTAPDSPVPRP